MNIELFPCSGGMTEGFHRAGIRFDMAVDVDPDACASHEINCGLRPLQMDARDFLRLVQAGWRPADGVNLFVADPPCTPWSRAGKRLGIADERDMLHVTTEIIRLLRPSAYLIGNVPGLEDSSSWPALQSALAPLRKAGYCIADFTTFDCADFGVPQHRIRPFWFGHLDGPCIAWPLPTHAAPDVAAVDMFGLKPWVTCRDALGHLSGEDLGRSVRLRYRGQNGKQVASLPEQPARAVGTSNLSDGNVLHVREDRRMQGPSEPARAVSARGHRDEHMLVADAKHPPSNPSNPSNTILMSDERAVLLTARARAILQGFPDGETTGTCERCCGPIGGGRWHFCAKTKRGVDSMIGQAMPPAMAHQVATSVRRQMEATDLRIKRAAE